MRHRKKFNHLSRKSGHRKAMLANMASSLIIRKRITTTTAKAKELRGFVEPLITRSREDSTHSRRVVFRSLRDKDAVSELFREVAVKVGDRPGGYTRIIKLEPRQGDGADVCMIELVDYNENLLGEKAAKTKSTRRRRGGKKQQTEGKVETGEKSKDETKVETEGKVETEEKSKVETKVETEEKVETAETEGKVETEEKPKVEAKAETAETTDEAGDEGKGEQEDEKEDKDADKGDKDKS